MTEPPPDGVPAIQKPFDVSAPYHDVLERALEACLAAFAELAGMSGQPDRAFRLQGALDILRLDRTPSIEVAPGHLGPVSGADCVCASRREDAPSTARQTRCLLSNREIEVAGLVAHGLTNRQIADQLVMSKRTVDTHVQNMLNKLGGVSRAQIAIWFIQHSVEVAG
jgi:DNA-binding CsgD family transcriptional regulator